MKKLICIVIVLFSVCFSSIVHSQDQKYLFRKVKKDSIVPFTGMLIDEETAMKIGKDKVELKDLRGKKAIEKPLWDFKEQTYKDTIKRQHEIIERMRKSWWDNNKLVVGVVIGFIAGVLSTYGVYEVVSRQTAK